MASTGKTTNYELSQFIGTDKPSWLGDYNGDMLKIDTALGSINATATTAQSGVASAQSAASAAQQTANSAQQTATANAQDITEIKDDLAFSSIMLTPSANISRANNAYMAKNNTLIITKGMLRIASSGITVKTTASTVDRVPLCSGVGNFYNLPLSTILNDSNRIFLGVSTLSTPSNSVYIYLTYAYYDGANTNIYIELPVNSTEDYPADTRIDVSSVTGLTGTLFSDVNNL